LTQLKRNIGVFLILWGVMAGHAGMILADGAAGKTPAAAPGGGPAEDLLVFQRQGWIWTTDGNGRSPARLIEGSLPAVSPDGRRIAFFKMPGGEAAADAAALWVYDRKTRSAAPVAQGLAVTSAPAWSVDGLRIACLARNDSGMSRVVVMGADGANRKTVFSAEADAASLWALSYTPDGGVLICHDMSEIYYLAETGAVRERVPLDRILGTAVNMITSADRFTVCPTDRTLLAFTCSVPGTRRFERIMHEPNTAIFLYDGFVGRGKNFRVTPAEITAFDPVWSPDGRRLYFTGYRDTQAAEADLFRIFRIDRYGTGLRELCRGESPSVAASPGF